MNDRMAYVTPATNIVLIKNCILQKSVNGETDTLYFETKELQTAYFNGLGNKVEYSPTTYQNISQGVMRIGKNMQTLYGCNYMYFINSGTETVEGTTYQVFENKRYYCFIDGLKYINNNCTEVYYSIDYLQTFMFNYQEKTCLVERMTTDDDTIGNYLLDEGLDLGSELKVLKVDEAYFNTWIYLVLFGYTDNLPNKRLRYNTGAGPIDFKKGVFTDFDFINNKATYFNEFVYSAPTGILDNNMPVFVAICTGVRRYNVLDGSTNPPIIDTNNITYVTFGITQDSWKVFGEIFTGRGICDKDSDGNSENAVTDYERLISCVYSAVLCPTKLTSIGTGGITNYCNTDSNFVSGKSPGTDTGSDCLQTIDGYTPKNKKLFTYPYVYLLACSSEGETQTYRFEWFTNTNKYYEFELSACAVPLPICCMTPKNYYLSDGSYNSIAGVVISNFQQIPLFTDSYKEYVAKNRYRDNIAMTNAVLSGVGSIVSPIYSGAMVGASPLTDLGGMSSAFSAPVSAGININQKFYEIAKRNEVAKMTPPGLIGQIGTPDLKVYLNKFGYYLLTMGIDSSRAKVIDDYFTRYGYKLAKNIIPSRNNNGNRSIFTFIKTVECNLAINQYANAATTFVMSQEDEKAIEAIYNNGVRFWYGTYNSARYYKDYSVDNSVTSNSSNNNSSNNSSENN